MTLLGQDMTGKIARRLKWLSDQRARLLFFIRHVAMVSRKTLAPHHPRGWQSVLFHRPKDGRDAQRSRSRSGAPPRRPQRIGARIQKLVFRFGRIPPPRTLEPQETASCGAPEKQNLLGTIPSRPKVSPLCLAPVSRRRAEIHPICAREVLSSLKQKLSGCPVSSANFTPTRNASSATRPWSATRFAASIVGGRGAREVVWVTGAGLLLPGPAPRRSTAAYRAKAEPKKPLRTLPEVFLCPRDRTKCHHAAQARGLLRVEPACLSRQFCDQVDQRTPSGPDDVGPQHRMGPDQQHCTHSCRGRCPGTAIFIICSSVRVSGKTTSPEGGGGPFHKRMARPVCK